MHSSGPMCVTSISYVCWGTWSLGRSNIPTTQRELCMFLRITTLNTTIKLSLLGVPSKHKRYFNVTYSHINLSVLHFNNAHFKDDSKEFGEELLWASQRPNKTKPIHRPNISKKRSTCWSIWEPLLMDNIYENNLLFLLIFYSHSMVFHTPFKINREWL